MLQRLLVPATQLCASKFLLLSRMQCVPSHGPVIWEWKGYQCDMPSGDVRRTVLWTGCCPVLRKHGEYHWTLWTELYGPVIESFLGKLGLEVGGCAGVSVDDGSTTRMTESNGTQKDQHLNGLGGYYT
jgi:hypothetical protein